MDSRDYDNIPVIHSYSAAEAIEDGALISMATATADPPIKDLLDITSMDEYLCSYGRILGHKAIDSLSPLHVPGRDELPDFSDMGRQPFPAQANVIAAAVKMMDHKGSGFIVGQMGSGKTLLGMSGVHKHACRSRKRGGQGGKYRAIVLCPDHLIAKWEREINETIPGATVTRFGPRRAFDDEADRDQKRRVKGKANAKKQSGTRESLRDVLKLLDNRVGNRWKKPEGPEWYVLGRNQAKWLSDWAGLADHTTERGNSISSKNVVIEKVPILDEMGRATYDPKTGKTVMKTITSRAYYCPTCGTVVRNQKGVAVGQKDLSADTKNATAKRCQGRYIVSKFDPEKPNIPGGERAELPARFAEKKPGDEISFRGKRWEVRACNEALYNYTSSPYRWAPARIIQKKLKRLFTYLIIDEVHEHKSDESGQSMACSKIMAGAKHILALTGTIIGGYADHLFPLMMRICPETLRAEGFEWGKDLPFSEVYGRIDRIITTKEDDPSTSSVQSSAKSMRRAKNGKSSERKQVRPGIMPPLFGNHLIGSSMFITLAEMSEGLPDLFEYVGGPKPLPPDDLGEEDMDLWKRMEAGYIDTAVDMSPTQSAEYDRISAILEAANKELLRRGSMKLLGAMLWTLLDYPDRPFGWGHDKDVLREMRLAYKSGGGLDEALVKLAQSHTVGFWDKPGDRHIENWVGVVTPKSLPEAVVYPKEQALIDICKQQKKEGRQTWVYVQMTGKRDIQPRLKAILEREGLRVGVLRAKNVEPREREEWISQHGRDFDVMISHPELVSTGLDLFSKMKGGHNYATLVFYETGYKPFLIRQAAARAWRIGQPLDCRVYYLYYKGTMQHKAMNLVSKKMAASEHIEGKFSEEGLAAMAADDNMQMALAKSLSEAIDESDVQRTWAKIGTKKNKRAPGSALVEAGESAPPSPLDSFPIEIQMVAETILEGQHRPVSPEAASEFAGLADRLAQVDTSFEQAAMRFGTAAAEDDEPSPGIGDWQTGAGLEPFPWLKSTLERGAAAREEAEQARASDAGDEENAMPEVMPLPFRTSSSMPRVHDLINMSEAMRGAFERLSKDPDRVMTISDLHCITETAKKLEAMGLAQAVDGGWRCGLVGKALHDTQTWLKLYTCWTGLYLPLGIVKASHATKGEHYVRVVPCSSMSPGIEFLPVDGFPRVNSLPYTGSQKRELSEWYITDASEADRRAIAAAGICLGTDAGLLFDAEPAEQETEPEFEVPPAFFLEQETEAPELGLVEVDPGEEADDNASPEPAEPSLAVVGDEDAVPELTEEIMARMFENMLAHGFA